MLLARRREDDARSRAHLLDTQEEMRFCSADKIVFRALGNLDRRTQGISLEEVLAKIGYGGSLPDHFGKAYRKKWTAVGVEERMRGLGTTSP